LWKAFSSAHGHWVLWLVGIITAGITAFYMFRLLFKTFFGKNYSELVHKSPEQEPSGTPVCCDTDNSHLNNSHGHGSHGTHHGPAHESPWIMTVPLVILAVLSIIGGYVGIPMILGGANHIEHFMEPVFSSPAEHQAEAPADSHQAENSGNHNLELILMIVSVLVAFGGIGVAYYIYILKPHMADNITNKFRLAYTLIFNKYYVDEIYQKVIVNNLLRLNNLLAYRIDLGVIDWLVNATGLGTVKVSNGSGWTDQTFVDGAVNGTADSVLLGGKVARVPQTGKLKHYLTWAVAGAVIFIISFWLLLK
ncbi:MAG: hypothetical protein V1709_00500, partial [Planctomycetota bacterium]